MAILWRIILFPLMITIIYDFTDFKVFSTPIITIQGVTIDRPSKNTFNPMLSSFTIKYKKYSKVSFQKNRLVESISYEAKNTSIVKNKRVILLQHGFIDSSDTWIVNDPSLAPAFYFADKGFDVWVGNSRGNRYSRKSLSPVVLDFWNFSFDQMAKYDLPASLKYINKITQRKIHYIGHSQGTLIMFIALSSKYEGVEEYLASFNAYGPVTYMKQTSSKAFTSLSKTPIPSLLYKNHVKWVLMYSKVALRMSGILCKLDKGPFISLLKISEKNITVDNLERLPMIMSHYPSGSSMKNLVHYQQYIYKDQFSQFDYGEKKNLIVYGQKNPPLYNLSQITFPVHLYVGKYDKIADISDATRLYKQLINSQQKVQFKSMQTMKIYDFGHATFIWGKTTEHLDDSIVVIDSAQPITKDNQGVFLQNTDSFI